ncbi:IS1634 family transposase, partial [Candidatus Cardinium sp. cBcalN2]|uniref:IS1634 family transposase n=1 Tax=Candidatus Cardinium sp. cBcalN2 TaxID=2699436 RepID=UPI001FB2DE2B
DQELLSTYKEQSGTESGFKFIKDNTFEVDSIFLKKPERISALMMLMTLCLMVYSFAQYFLRKQLVSSNETVLSQSGYATNRPSMQWVYRLFHGIHVIKLQVDHAYHEIVLNMNEVLIKIVRYFGPVACAIYD